MVESGFAVGGWASGDTSHDFRYLLLLEELLERRLAHLAGWGTRVKAVAVEIGKLNGLDRPDLTALAIGAKFHDLGLLGIPGTILEAKRELTAAELAIVSGHVQLGGQLLNLAFYDRPEVLEPIWFHHERIDGKGPLALTGDLIPVSARITSVTDALVAMSSERPHHSALDREEVLCELAKGVGTQFDEVIVRSVQRRQETVFAALAAVEPAEPLPVASIAAPKMKFAPPPARVVGSSVAPVGAAGAQAPPAAVLPPLTAAELSARLKQIQGLQALPTSVCEVISLTSSKNTERTQLAKAIQQDVALAAKLLRTANSAAFHRGPQRASSVEEAIASLGFSGVANVAIGMEVLRDTGTGEPGSVDHARLWAHSIACG